MIEVVDKQLCCGCSACVQYCPKHCISLQEDKEGFLYPLVEKDNCIDCHLCEKVCPFLNEAKDKKPIATLAAYNKSEQERQISSPGGIFILLAQETINKGGVVFGAVFDEYWKVKHAYAESLEEVYPMLQSKYVQSDVGTTYQEVERFLKSGRHVLYCGTPCQISGLNHFLKKRYAKLTLVDFLCHGVPSPGVWRKYVTKELSKAARSAVVGKNTVLSLSLNPIPTLGGIEFRNKTQRGWKKYSFVVRSSSALKADKNSVLLSDNHKVNPYMKGFLSDIYLRPSCYQCKCKNGRSGSDLTLGDFWCVERLDDKIDDDKGLSLLLINNEYFTLPKGLYTKEFQYDEIKVLNGGFKESHVCNTTVRNLFFLFYTYFNLSTSLKYSFFIGKLIHKIRKLGKIGILIIKIIKKEK